LIGLSRAYLKVTLRFLMYQWQRFLEPRSPRPALSRERKIRMTRAKGWIDRTQPSRAQCRYLAQLSSPGQERSQLSPTSGSPRQSLSCKTSSSGLRAPLTTPTSSRKQEPWLQLTFRLMTHACLLSSTSILTSLTWTLVASGTLTQLAQSRGSFKACLQCRLWIKTTKSQAQLSNSCYRRCATMVTGHSTTWRSRDILARRQSTRAVRCRRRSSKFLSLPL